MKLAVFKEKDRVSPVFPAVWVPVGSRLHCPESQVSWWLTSPFYNLPPLISCLNVWNLGRDAAARLGRHSFVGTCGEVFRSRGSRISPTDAALISVLMWPQQPRHYIIVLSLNLSKTTITELWFHAFAVAEGGHDCCMTDDLKHYCSLLRRLSALKVWQCFQTSAKSKNSTSSIEILC